MAINKNFVVKNGLEVKTDLLVADTTTNNVGIGTTIASYKLHVNGGIGATDLYISGVSTFAGIGTFSNDLYVDGSLSTTEDATLGRNLRVGGISTFVGFSTFQNNVFVAGISTFAGFSTFRNNVLVAGISTFVSDSTFQNNVYVTGVSTFVGVSTFQGDLYVGGDLYIADDLRFDEFTARNINVTGVGTIATLDTDSGTIDYLSAINLNASGIGTVPKLFSTSADLSNGYINVGVVTHLTSTNLSASGISTLGVTSATNLTAQQLNVSGVSTISTTNISGDLTFTGNNDLYLKDSGVINFGDSNDLQIYHNGLLSVIREGGTGGLLIDSNNEIKLGKNGTGSDTLAIFTPDGPVELYYDNSKKLETTGGGITVTGVATATGGFNLGISSAGTTITSGPITTLNFVGTGNTFAVNGTTIDISIQGGGAGAGGTWTTYTAGIATSKSVGVNTTNLDDSDLTGIGNSFQGLYVGNGMIIVDNQLNGDHYIGTNFNGLMAGPVTINGTLTVDGNYVVV